MAKGRQPTNDSFIIMEPSEMDVLCSKDKSVAKHPGNIAFRERIEEVTAVYSKTTNKQEKMKMTRDIVSYMQLKHASRFLKKEGNAWVEINNQTARDKVSHALRFAAKQLKQTSGASSAAVASTAAGTKKAQKEKHGRKRSMCSLSSTESSQDSANTCHSGQSSVVSGDEEPLFSIMPVNDDDFADVEVPVASIFMRQQNILTDMKRKSEEGYLDFHDFHSMSLLRHEGDSQMMMMLPQLPQPEFNTLRSEDLNELMREPMFASHDGMDGEWDVVEQMAEC